jgi:hypothetical protein
MLTWNMGKMILTTSNVSCEPCEQKSPPRPSLCSHPTVLNSFVNLVLGRRQADLHEDKGPAVDKSLPGQSCPEASAAAVGRGKKLLAHP